MSGTNALLVAAFGRDLGQLIYAYFAVPALSALELANAGNYEAILIRSLDTRGLTHHGDYFVINGIDAFWHGVFFGACEGGYLEMIELARSHRIDSSTLSYGARFAANHGQLAVIKYLCTISDNINLNLALRAACGTGHQDIVRFLADNGATRCYSCNKLAAEHI